MFLKENFKTVAVKAQNQLSQNGFCRIKTNPEKTDRKTLLRLVDDLDIGQRQDHLRGDSYGIADVTNNASNAKAAMVKEQYLDVGTGWHGPHTDGTMLNGLTKKDDLLIKVSAPKFVVLQMVQPAQKGGASILVDGEQILEDLLNREPEVAELLLQPVVYYCRDDQISDLSPVFRKLPSSQNWAMQWRYDFTTLVKPSAKEAFIYLYQNYISNPKYQHRFFLKKGEILVVDNFRVLHAREAYVDNPSSPRWIRRVWIADQIASFVNPNDETQNQRALDRYLPYSPFETEVPSSSFHDNGIHLSPTCQGIAQQLLSENLQEESYSLC